MKKQLLLLLLIISNFASNTIATNAKIVASNTPIAGIVQMIVGNTIDVTAIEITNGCPHHYHAKPSDKIRVEFSDVAVYVDDNFETFFKKLLHDYNGDIIKISDVKTITFQEGVDRVNWHFWLDLGSVREAITGLAQILKVKYPTHAESFDLNAKEAFERLDRLENERVNVMNNINVPIIISESVEHFFDEGDPAIFMIKKRSPSLNYASKLSEEIERNPNHCLIIDRTEKIENFLKYSDNIIQFNVENWHTNETKEYAEIFYSQYEEILNAMKKCKVSKTDEE